MNVWAAIAFVVADMKSHKKLALASVLTALCVIFLFIGSVFQTLDLSAAAIGSIIVLIAIIEIGSKWAFGVYLASSVISILILPYKSAAIVFALFAGFYPLIKLFLNKIKPIFLSYLARHFCFNLPLALIIWCQPLLFPAESLDFSNIIGYLLVIFCNIVFVIFDFALERIAFTYVTRIKPRIFGRR